jgi:hypothetical protein
LNFSIEKNAFKHKIEKDDMYILPLENYQTMTIENYIQLIVKRKYDQEEMGEMTRRNMDIIEKERCKVFFIDEYTSLLYLIL